MFKWLKSFFAEPVRERGLIQANIGNGKGGSALAIIEVTIMERAGDKAKVWYHSLGDPLSGRYISHSVMAAAWGEWVPLDQIELIKTEASGAP